MTDQPDVKVRSTLGYWPLDGSGFLDPVKSRRRCRAGAQKKGERAEALSPLNPMNGRLEARRSLVFPS